MTYMRVPKMSKNRDNTGSQTKCLNDSKHTTKYFLKNRMIHIMSKIKVTQNTQNTLNM